MKVNRDFVYADRRLEQYSNNQVSGWLLKDKPHFDPISFQYRAHVLVHDILEHHNEDGDGVEFEMMAFGSTFYIRDLGDWSGFRYQSAEDVLYSDLTYFLRNTNYELIDTDGEIHPDLMERYHQVTSRVEESQLLNDREFKTRMHLFDRAFKWISKGYMRACMRWKASSSHDVCRLFESMVQRFDKMGHGIEGETHSCDGWHMRVTFDTETLEYSIKFHMGNIDSLSCLSESTIERIREITRQHDIKIKLEKAPDPIPDHEWESLHQEMMATMFIPLKNMYPHKIDPALLEMTKMRVYSEMFDFQFNRSIMNQIEWLEDKLCLPPAL